MWSNGGCGFKVWLKESEDVRWERMIEALLAIGLDELAKAVKEKFCSPPETEEVPKPADESLKEKAGGRFLDS